MILLTFTSVAKYVLSLMLAVLGIISFDQIDLPPANENLKMADYYPGILPMDPVQAKTFSTDSFHDLMEQEVADADFIDYRTDFNCEEGVNVFNESEECIHLFTKVSRQILEQENKIILIIDQQETIFNSLENAVVVKAGL